MFLFSSCRSHPFLLQNTTSCFELTFQACSHHGEISSKCFFFFFFSIASFHHLGDCTLYILSMIPNIYHSTVNLYPFLPSISIPLTITLIHLFNSFICFCQKHGEKISVPLPYEVTHLFSSHLFSHLFSFCTVKTLK